MAFAEAGRPPEVPGPMLRVRVGTVVRATLTNRLDSTMVVHGLSGRRSATMDSLVLRPGETRVVRFVAEAEGTYFYWATWSGKTFGDRLFLDAQLNGALIVDPRDGTANDRVFVISQSIGQDSAGESNGTEFLSINGRPWPYTERFTYAVGDSVRWRWVNASENAHPLHLHGFYYRILARGDAARDTVYWPAQQRMAVTELLNPQQTMRMEWSPDRPGGWIFHCHLTFHILPNAPLISDSATLERFFNAEFSPNEVHDPANHVERHMGGLMLGLYVKPTHPMTPTTGTGRLLRLFVQSGKIAGDTARRHSFILASGRDPAADSVTRWAPTLVLHRGEPTTIRVINRAKQATMVHWHGLEIESPFDGVVGVGGYSGSPVPPIMPGDSFDVRVTPPRSGSFMYHTHMNELVQQAEGLWGPLLVLDPGKELDPVHDLVLQVGTRPDNLDAAVLRMGSVTDTLTLEAGERYRLRLMNVSMANPGIEFWMFRPAAQPYWTQVARDGFDLPAWQRQPMQARLHVGIGETKDVEITAPPAAGPLTLQVRSGGGRLLASQAFRVVVRDSTKR
jgi:FtsP/CotA-like multicopper oxidase with cupredoxin domain